MATESNPMDSAPMRSRVLLKGSSKYITDYFEYSIHSILYQRGVYPPEDFKLVKKYGLGLLVSVDDELRSYIRRVISQLHKWIVSAKLSKLVLCIVEKDTNEVVERWQFDVSVTRPLQENNAVSVTTTGNNQMEKPESEIHREIQAIIRQITASTTFLPLLTSPCTFSVLVYANQNATVPDEWIDSKDRPVAVAENVQFRSFSTAMHKIDTMVSYRVNE